MRSKAAKSHTTAAVLHLQYSGNDSWRRRCQRRNYRPPPASSFKSFSPLDPVSTSATLPIISIGGLKAAFTGTLSMLDS